MLIKIPGAIFLIAIVIHLSVTGVCAQGTRTRSRTTDKPDIIKLTPDKLSIVSITPPSGFVLGATSSTQSLDEKNSIKISYSYDLVTKNSGEIRQWLLVDGGAVAPNNFWTWSPISKGKGQANNKATIRCPTPMERPVVIKGIHYKLVHEGVVLTEGVKVLPGLAFSCSGYLQLHKLTPPRGSIIDGPKEGEPLTDNNSVRITYRYRYFETVNARVAQHGLDQDGEYDLFQRRTHAILTEGEHTVSTQLTVTCKSPRQAKRKIKTIRYGIYPSARPAMYEKTEMVDLTFRCNKGSKKDLK